MNEKEFIQIAVACDRFLKKPDVPFEIIALPWLHVLNQHPINVSKYESLVQGAFHASSLKGSQAYLKEKARQGVSAFIRKALLVRKLFHPMAFYEDWKFISYELDRIRGDLGKEKDIDVLLISWLVNVEHLNWSDDFYFGNLQSMLAERGLTSIVILQNQTGYPTKNLLAKAPRDGRCHRLLLPNVSSLAEELKYIRRCIEARQKIRNTESKVLSWLERAVAKKVQALILSSEVIDNLRLHEQILQLCLRMRPSILICLYEGHAWERCVWHAARISSKPVLCVGYQHTILFKHSHAVKRPLNPARDYDPDFILTVGDITREILEKNSALQGIPVITYGTHRRAKGTPLLEEPKSIPTFLVLPEGIESECFYLFEFALECAKRLPNVRFIFRTHPVLPFERIEGKLKGYSRSCRNVEVSHEKLIDTDFGQSGFLLYRGSSTVLYAILAGLKPFYITKVNEIDIDPLYSLLTWREYANSVDDLISKYHKHQLKDQADITKDWLQAKEFCDRYIQPVRENAIDRMLELARQTSQYSPKGISRT